MSARLAARLAYAGVILLATLAGLRPDPDLAAAAARASGALHRDLIPGDAVDAVRNVALFAGWGVVWLLGEPRRRWPRALLGATLGGAALSATVETAQLFSAARNANVLDLLFNTLGAAAGAVLTLGLLRTVAAARPRARFAGVPLFLFAGAYGAAVLLEAFVPLFRQAMAPGAEGGPGARLAASLLLLRREPLGPLPWAEGLLWVPAGVLGVLALVELGRGRRPGAALTTFVALALAVAVEAARGVAGYPIGPGAAAVHTAGATGGALAAAWLLPRLARRTPAAARPGALFAAYAAVLAGWSWRPFLPRPRLADALAQLAPVHWVPLRALAGRGDLFSVADVGVQFLLLLPVGALLAVHPLARHGVGRGLLPALLLAAVLELGQVAVRERFFDVTDPLIQMAGAAVGWAVAQRAGLAAERGGASLEGIGPASPRPRRAQ